MNETGEEINEYNLTDVLEAAGVDVEESRVKALVAALEDVDIEEAVEQSAAVPAAGGAAAGGAAPSGEADADADEAEAEAEGEASGGVGGFFRNLFGLLAMLPLLGVAPIEKAAAPFANPIVFLFLGGFCIAVAMQRWNLHRRVALMMLLRVGTRPARVVGGFLLATAGLSMWVSNTATATMMLPIAVTVSRLIDDAQDENRSTVPLLLAIAFGANIGGIGTLIGTPPNALLAGYMQEAHGIEIGFGQWMLVGVPFSLVMLGIAWVVLTRFAFKLPDRVAAEAETAVREQLADLGPMSRGEKLVLGVFAATALLWLLRPFLQGIFGEGLSDPAIAVVAALALFSTPVDVVRRTFLLDWSDTAKLPWGVLILVGGGLSLGSAVEVSGLSGWVASNLEQLATFPVWIAVAALSLVVILISHITSNTATTAMFLPLAGSFAATIGVSPALTCLPVALAASCAFMMPVATPPNAIVFGSGQLSVADMVKAGALINLAAVGVLQIVVLTLVPLVVPVAPG
jgi:sodium-dependent dicarboxylate transporter 2/3/5